MDKLTKSETVLLEIAVQLGEASSKDTRRQATSLVRKGLALHSGSFISPTVKPTPAGREWVDSHRNPRSASKERR